MSNGLRWTIVIVVLLCIRGVLSLTIGSGPSPLAADDSALSAQPDAGGREAPVESASRRPEPPTPKPKTEMTEYVQPVYEGVFKRVGKLIEMHDHPGVTPKQRREGAEKTLEFAAHYKGSEFPKDFLTVLANLEGDMRLYARLQEQMERDSQRDPGRLAEREKMAVEKMRSYLERLNRVAANHGCTTYDVP